MVFLCFLCRTVMLNLFQLGKPYGLIWAGGDNRLCPLLFTCPYTYLDKTCPILSKWRVQSKIWLNDPLQSQLLYILAVGSLPCRSHSCCAFYLCFVMFRWAGGRRTCRWPCQARRSVFPYVSFLTPVFVGLDGYREAAVGIAGQSKTSHVQEL